MLGPDHGFLAIIRGEVTAAPDRCVEIAAGLTPGAECHQDVLHCGEILEVPRRAGPDAFIEAYSAGSRSLSIDLCFLCDPPYEGMYSLCFGHDGVRERGTILDVQRIREGTYSRPSLRSSPPPFVFSLTTESNGEAPVRRQLLLSCYNFLSVYYCLPPIAGAPPCPRLSAVQRRHVHGLYQMSLDSSFYEGNRKDEGLLDQEVALASFFKRGASHSLPEDRQLVSGTQERLMLQRIKRLLHSPQARELAEHGYLHLNEARRRGELERYDAVVYPLIKAYEQGYADGVMKSPVILDGCYGAGKRR